MSELQSQECLLTALNPNRTVPLPRALFLGNIRIIKLLLALIVPRASMSHVEWRLDVDHQRPF